MHGSDLWAGIQQLLLKLSDARFIRYLMASVGALTVDVVAFLFLLTIGLAPASASAIGYSLGIAAHWIISSRAVFADRVAQRGTARTRQKLMFVISALTGLVLTTAIVGAADWAGVDPRAAKLVAIIASFALTWVLRNQIVFRHAREPAPINQAPINKS